MGRCTTIRWGARRSAERIVIVNGLLGARKTDGLGAASDEGVIEADGLSADGAAGDRWRRALDADTKRLGAVNDFAGDPGEQMREPVLGGRASEIGDPGSDGAPDISWPFGGGVGQTRRETSEGTKEAFFRHSAERITRGMGIPNETRDGASAQAQCFEVK